MGTRCVTNFYDSDSKELKATIYRQVDGYPTGHGKELYDWLNELLATEKLPYKFAYADKLATLFVVEFYNRGNLGIYIKEPGFLASDIEYVYDVFYVQDEQRFEIRVTSNWGYFKNLDLDSAIKRYEEKIHS